MSALSPQEEGLKVEHLNLTGTQIRYLLTISRLHQTQQHIRSLDIAILLGLAKPSVHKMMNTFMDLGLVNKEPYGEIILTEAGKQTAAAYEQYYMVISKILSPVISHDEQTEYAIFNFLSGISEKSLESVRLYLGDS